MSLRPQRPLKIVINIIIVNFYRQKINDNQLVAQRSSIILCINISSKKTKEKEKLSDVDNTHFEWDKHRIR